MAMSSLFNRPETDARTIAWDKDPENAKWLQAMYTKHLGRDVDEEGLTYWGGDLRGDAGRPIQTRTEVLANIMLSPEYSCHQKGGFYVHKTQMCVSKDSIYAELNKEVV
ncbi:MAG: hypothetical protein CMA30_08795 [Euryarchaeota archaeon]|jgi:hypothetical protein|nr:hypothetical protein [Euryarchaeota archaeon]|tara:strand:+ start:2238 stop:2564 length:327 start_codon:yes stop_codon:yes gene_type:complete